MLGKFLRVALAYPMDEFTLPASITCPQDWCKAGTSLGRTDTQLGSCLEGLHWTLPWSKFAIPPHFVGGLGKPGLWDILRERSQLGWNSVIARAIRKFLVSPISNGRSRRGNFEHPGRNVQMLHLVERRDRQIRLTLQQLAPKYLLKYFICILDWNMQKYAF